MLEKTFLPYNYFLTVQYMDFIVNGMQGERLDLLYSAHPHEVDHQLGSPVKECFHLLIPRHSVRRISSEHMISTPYWIYSRSPGYRFTKGLTQNLNLRTNFQLEYNKKSHNYIQQN